MNLLTRDNPKARQSMNHRSLLTRRNSKTLRARSEGYFTSIMHLSPANTSGHQVCRFHTKECAEDCIYTSGHGGILAPGESTNSVLEARLARTRLFFEDRPLFLARLVHEIEIGIRYALRLHFIPCFRLNGTSDIAWEQIPVTRNGRRYKHVFRAFKDVQFYDYTKYPLKMRDCTIPNYDLTFSLAETLANHTAADQWLKAGHNAAVVFNVTKRKPTLADFPTTFLGRQVLNGDKDDLRFKDPKGGLIVALKAKGKAQHRTPGGFVQAVTLTL